jgi:hypothetical protein
MAGACELVEDALVSQDMGLGREGRRPRWDLMDICCWVGEWMSEGYSERGMG